MPIVTTSAPSTPTIAAIKVLVMITATARPPGTPPAHAVTALKMSSAMPERSNRQAMKTNSGTDTSTLLPSKVKMRLTTKVKPGGP